MIEIKLNSKNKKTSGNIRVHGDSEMLTNEIYLILVTLSKERPGPFEDAVEKHSLELMKKLVDEEAE